jgi:hypothetical protein
VMDRTRAIPAQTPRFRHKSSRIGIDTCTNLATRCPQLYLRPAHWATLAAFCDLLNKMFERPVFHILW